MKKATISMILGIALASWGILDLLYGISLLAPLAAYLGFFLAFSPWGISGHFSLKNFTLLENQYHTNRNEPLELARNYIGMSYLSRREGILSLAFNDFDAQYSSGIYHLGKELMIDGVAPETIQREFSSVYYAMRQRYREYIGQTVQMGKYLALSAIVGFISSGLALWTQEETVSFLRMSLWVALTLISITIALSMLYLLPGRMRQILYRRNLICRQMQVGLDSVQQNKSPLDTANAQIPFLTDDEADLLAQNPLPEILRKPESAENFDDVADTIRQRLRGIYRNYL